jgi:hypothetical protein
MKLLCDDFDESSVRSASRAYDCAWRRDGNITSRNSCGGSITRNVSQNVFVVSMIFLVEETKLRALSLNAQAYIALE